MGYYSKVSFTIVGKREDVVAELITFRFAEPLAKAAFDQCYFFEKDGRLFIRYANDCVTWGPEIDEVNALMRLWAYFADAAYTSENRFEGTFVRLDEDNGDEEEAQFGDVAEDMDYYERRIVSTYEFDDTKLGYAGLEEP